MAQHLGARLRSKRHASVTMERASATYFLVPVLARRRAAHLAASAGRPELS